MKILGFTAKPVILTGGRNVSVKTGDTLVYISVISTYENLKKLVKRIKTEIRVRPKDWDKKEGKVRRTDPEYVFKNTQISYARQDVEQDMDELINGKATMAKYRVYKGRYLDEKFVIDFIADYIEYRKALNTPNGTLKEFKSLKNRLQRFEKATYSRHQFRDITSWKFSDQFYLWMIKEKFSAGTIYKTYSILITVCNFYYDRKEDYGIVMADIFRSKKWKRGEPSSNEPNPLTEMQLKTLIDHKFKTDSLNIHKDRFLFQCTTGCRFGDAFKISNAQIKEGCIEYFPEKTRHKKDNLVIVPINEISQMILDKYDGDMTRLKISNQKYNQGLKDLFAELTEKYPELFAYSYSSHNARDTFITTSIDAGIDVPLLLMMVGQSSWAIMKRYYKPNRELGKEKMQTIAAFKLASDKE